MTHDPHGCFVALIAGGVQLATSTADEAAQSADQAHLDRMHPDEITTLKQAYDEISRRAATLETELFEANDQKVSMAQQLSEAAAMISALETKLEGATTELKSILALSESQQSDSRTAQEALRELLTRQQEDNWVLAESLGARVRQIKALQQSLTKVQAELKAIRASTSWRLTRPLRRAGGILKRRRRK